MNTWGQKLRQQRHFLFVGRRRERDRIPHFLSADCQQPLWYIEGPGGIGKSSLAHQIYDSAQEYGLHRAWVDARYIPANPPAVRHAIENDANGHGTAALADTESPTLLVIDTAEYWADLMPWLRDTFLPALPRHWRVVLISRQSPDSEWLADPGWQSLMHHTVLEPLTHSDCGDYLERRAIQGDTAESLIRLASGLPLVLAMAADEARDGHHLTQLPEDTTSLIPALTERLTREAETHHQQRALAVSAVAREVPLSLLQSLFDKEQATPLYRWLSRISCIRYGQKGLYPHDLVRDALMAQMRKQQPGEYEEIARAVVKWVVEQIEATPALTWDTASALCADGMYALREVPMVAHYLYPVGTESLYVSPAEEADWPGLGNMLAEHEGQASREWLDFWLERHPEGAFVVRDAHDVIQGFFFKLDMETLSSDDRHRDPLTRTLWQRAHEHLSLHPGDHMPFIRFWCTHDYARSHSPVKTKILMAINSYNMMAPRLRLTAQVYDRTTRSGWQDEARALGIDLLPDSDTVVGETTWRIYYNDWHRESPGQYYRRFADLSIGFEQNLHKPEQPGQPAGELNQKAFETAAIDAIRHWLNPKRLARNPLLASALVLNNQSGNGNEADRACVLKGEILQAAEDWAGNDSTAFKLLEKTHFEPSPSQKVLAERFGMSYSTFRRQLAETRQQVATTLWHRELQARG
ncbi:MAG: hypothetical protein ACQES2_08325 [Pseudomonadota bacterium]